MERSIHRRTLSDMISVKRKLHLIMKTEKRIQTEENVHRQKRVFVFPGTSIWKYVCIESTIPENVEGIQPFW